MGHLREKALPQEPRGCGVARCQFNWTRLPPSILTVLVDLAINLVVAICGDC